MSNDPSLTLAKWFSPGTPIVAFNESRKLAPIVGDGEISGQDDISDWLETQLEAGIGYIDALFIGAAFDARDSSVVNALNDLCMAYAENCNRNMLDTNAKAAIMRDVTAPAGGGLQSLAYPVAVGCAARQAGLPLDMTVRFYLHALTWNLLAIAEKLLPGDKLNTQSLMHVHADRIAQIARDSLTIRSIDIVPHLRSMSDIPPENITRFEMLVAG